MDEVDKTRDVMDMFEPPKSRDQKIKDYYESYKGINSSNILQPLEPQLQTLHQPPQQLQQPQLQQPQLQQPQQPQLRLQQPLETQLQQPQLQQPLQQPLETQLQPETFDGILDSSYSDMTTGIKVTLDIDEQLSIPFPEQFKEPRALSCLIVGYHNSGKTNLWKKLVSFDDDDMEMSDFINTHSDLNTKSTKINNIEYLFLDAECPSNKTNVEAYSNFTADLVLYVIDITQEVFTEIIEDIKSLRSMGLMVIVVPTKTDLLPEDLELYEKTYYLYKALSDDNLNPVLYTKEKYLLDAKREWEIENSLEMELDKIVVDINEPVVSVNKLPIFPMTNGTNCVDNFSELIGKITNKILFNHLVNGPKFEAMLLGIQERIEFGNCLVVLIHGGGLKVNDIIKLTKKHNNVAVEIQFLVEYIWNYCPPYESLEEVKSSTLVLIQGKVKEIGQNEFLEVDITELDLEFEEEIECYEDEAENKDTELSAIEDENEDENKGTELSAIEDEFQEINLEQVLQVNQPLVA